MAPKIQNPMNFIPDYSFLGEAGNILGGMIKETPDLLAFDRQIRENDNFNNEMYDALDATYRAALNDTDEGGVRSQLANKLGIASDSPELDKAVMSKLRRSGDREGKNEYMSEMVLNSVGLFEGMGESLPQLAQLASMGGSAESRGAAKEAYEGQRTKESRKALFANADKGTYGKSSDFWADAEKNNIDPESLSKDPRAGGVLSGIKAKGVTNAQNSVMDVFRLRYDPDDAEGKTPDSFDEMLNVALTKGYAALDDPNDPIQRAAVQEMVDAQKGIELAQKKSNGELAKMSMEERKLLVAHLENTLKRDGAREKELIKLKGAEFISPKDLDEVNKELTYLTNTIKKNQTLADTVHGVQTQAFEPEAKFDGPQALTPNQEPALPPAPTTKDTEEVIATIKLGEPLTPDQAFALGVKEDLELVKGTSNKWYTPEFMDINRRKKALLEANPSNKLKPRGDGTFLWTRTSGTVDYPVGVFDAEMNFVAEGETDEPVAGGGRSGRGGRGEPTSTQPAPTDTITPTAPSSNIVDGFDFSGYVDTTEVQ